MRHVEIEQDIICNFVPAPQIPAGGFAMQMDQQALEGGTDPVFGTVQWRTLICANKTPSSGLVFGVATFGPLGSLNPHRHPPAEFYFGLSGSGTVTIEGVEIAINAGTAVFIPPNARHGVVAGDDGLVFAYGFPSDTFDAVAYDFS
ncbi:cupin domain-containing protein [Roseibium sediminicola]|uniref:Cupin domain-containing protein n=1 Tax=Roseibium sediminicola TaxID=2933272 RepID=A0ABT0GQI8_9HYPH|nr:cupin domain-containing protein [Roseibium sp. CAU 1639]MCK7611674.1 cupin domain-containing protein [Roseibium sp. CAU 1639]